MAKSKRDVALLLMVNKQGRLLMQHRTDDAPRYPDYWSLFGGGVEEGETPEDALKREIIEELHYIVNNPALIFKTEYEHDEFFGARYVFFERYDDNQRIILGEGQGFAWMTIPEITSLKISSNTLKTLQSLQQEKPELLEGIK